MNIACLQHVPFEGPGTIADWAAERGHRLTPVRLFAGDPLPAAAEIEGLVVMGGPMSAYDEQAYGWLRGEKELISQAIARGRMVLGVCLGAQLIAASLGARVYAGGLREIGWHALRTTPAAAGARLCSALPAAFEALHWHGDTFDLPAGAVHTVESAAYAHQAFEIPPAVLALQFHLEATAEGVSGLVEACGDELGNAGPWVQSAAAIRRPDAPFARNAALLARLLDRMQAALPSR